MDSPFTLDQETTLSIRNLFPEYRLPCREMQLMTQRRGNGNLPSLSDGCFHMMILSCAQVRDNRNNSQSSLGPN